MISVAQERFDKHGKSGVRTWNGKVIIKPMFDAIGWSDGSFSMAGDVTGYRIGDRWGLVRSGDKTITPAEFSELNFQPEYGPATPVFTARKEIHASLSKAGCIDTQGQEVIPFNYDRITIAGDRAILLVKDETGYRFGLCDLEHRMLLEPIWQDIRPAPFDLFSVTDTRGKVALFGRSGNKLTDFDLDSIGKASGNLLAVYGGSYYGLIDRKGSWVRYPSYKSAEPNDDGSWDLERYNQWILISRENQEKRILELDELTPIRPGVMLARRGTRQGLVNEQLREFWPLEYDLIKPSIQDLMIAGKHGKLGIARHDGRYLIPPRYDRIAEAGNTLALAERMGQTERWYLFRKETGTISPNGYHAIVPEGDIFRVRRNGFEGLASGEGELLLDCVYDSILALSENTVAVRFMGKYGLMTRSGTWILLPQDDKPILLTDSIYFMERKGVRFIYRIPDHLIWFTEHTVRRNGNTLEEWATESSTALRRMDFNGREIRPMAKNTTLKATSAQVTETTPVFQPTEGMRGILENGKYGFRDMQGRLRIPNRYDSILPFSEGLAAVKLNGKWGFLDASDRLVFQPKFDLPATFSGSAAVVRMQGKYGIIDRNGFRLEPLYDEIKPAGDRKHFILRRGTYFGLCSANGTLLLETRFESIQLTGNEQVLVRNGLYGVVTTSGLAVIPIKYESLHFLPESGMYLGKVAGAKETIR